MFKKLFSLAAILALFLTFACGGEEGGEETDSGGTTLKVTVRIEGTADPAGKKIKVCWYKKSDPATWTMPDGWFASGTVVKDTDYPFTLTGVSGTIYMSVVLTAQPAIPASGDPLVVYNNRSNAEAKAAHTADPIVLEEGEENTLSTGTIILDGTKVY